MLTDTEYRIKPPGAKTPNDSRLWRWKYRYGGKEKLLAIGPYPAVSVKKPCVAGLFCSACNSQAELGMFQIRSNSVAGAS